jgi:hypothetical protein
LDTGSFGWLSDLPAIAGSGESGGIALKSDFLKDISPCQECGTCEKEDFVPLRMICGTFTHYFAAQNLLSWLPQKALRLCARQEIEKRVRRLTEQGQG